MYSPKHKALFVHIPKTGGQSVETVFLQDLKLTWQERDALLLRPSKRRDGPERLAHLYAEEYVRLGYLTQSEFDAAYRFSIVRHPFSRMVSEYRYRADSAERRKKQGKRAHLPDFDRFIRREFEDDHSDMARHLAPQVTYLLDENGHLLVENVMRLETLNTEIEPVLRRIFGRTVDLPHRNASVGYSDISVERLSLDQKAFLFQKYQDDFEAFGYER
jgi:hypothetical protein